METQGALEVGDYVYGHDGKPTRVMACSEVEYEPCYALQFSTGETIIAGERHRWVVQGERDRAHLTRRDPEWKARRRASRSSRSKGAASGKPWLTAGVAAQSNTRRAQMSRDAAAPVDPWEFTRVLETREVVAMRARERKAITVPRPPAIHPPAGAWPLATSPWALGMWMGDGTRGSATITHGQEDAWCLRERMAACGYPLAWHDANGRAKHYRFAGLAEHLVRDVGPAKTRRKHIPDAVYTAAFEDRLAVAQGLIDSDGHVNERGQVEFCLTNEALFRDCIRLFATLGIRVSQNRREAAYTKGGVRHVTGWRWTAKFTTHLPLATYPRKLARITARPLERTDVGRRATIKIESITRIADIPLRCIQVDDPRGVYLAGETLVPTHNSDALLMAALQYVDTPGYSAIIFRRISPDLHGADGMVERSKAWLMPTLGERAWNATHLTWTFPSGATLRFGHMQYEDDKFKFQGHAYHFCGFDELTHFSESQYRYLFSRLTRPSDGPLSRIPIRMRAASNPGGFGHSWVKRRFIDKLVDETDPEDTEAKVRARAFVPARVVDNPSIDREAYVRSLAQLEPEVRAQLLDGDWDARQPGDWYFDDQHHSAIVRLGRQYARALAAGTMPAPVGGQVHLGVDWGDHAAAVLLWPLEGGGMFAVREFVEAGGELHSYTRSILGLNDMEWPFGQARHDASAPISIGTFHLLANQQLGHGAPKQFRVAFGEWKGITCLHLRRLARRAHEGLPGHLAVGPGCPRLLEELSGLRRDEESVKGAWKKEPGQDAADALVAGVAPLAREFGRAANRQNRVRTAIR